MWTSNHKLKCATNYYRPLYCLFLVILTKWTSFFFVLEKQKLQFLRESHIFFHTITDDFIACSLYTFRFSIITSRTPCWSVGRIYGHVLIYRGTELIYIYSNHVNHVHFQKTLEKNAQLGKNIYLWIWNKFCLCVNCTDFAIYFIWHIEISSFYLKPSQSV